MVKALGMALTKLTSRFGVLSKKACVRLATETGYKLVDTTKQIGRPLNIKEIESVFAETLPKKCRPQIITKTEDVADILKNRGIDTIVFGGSRRNIDNNVCKYLSNHIDNSRILIVDSGLLMAENKVLLSPDFTCNDGSKISALSLIAGTIKMDNNKLLLANKSYNQIKKYVEIIADSICEYFSFVDLLCLDNK